MPGAPAAPGAAAGWPLCALCALLWRLHTAVCVARVWRGGGALTAQCCVLYPGMLKNIQWTVKKKPSAACRLHRRGAHAATGTTCTNGLTRVKGGGRDPGRLPGYTYTVCVVERALAPIDRSRGDANEEGDVGPRGAGAGAILRTAAGAAGVVRPGEMILRTAAGAGGSDSSKLSKAVEVSPECPSGASSATWSTSSRRLFRHPEASAGSFQAPRTPD